MTTVVNTPGNNTGESGNGMGMVVGAIILLVVLFLLFFYGLPLLRRGADAPSAPATNNITVPVPDKVDVNVTQPQQ